MARIATFYHFADFVDFRDWRMPLKNLMIEQGVRGSILLAPEGLNATIAGSQEGVQAVLDYLGHDSRFSRLFVKWSDAAEIPFQRAKVRLKKEIITLGLPANVPERTGKILSPQEWNKLLEDPQVALLDTRNSYETHLGTFENAIVWPLEDFQELPAKIQQNLDKKQKIAMFCTGGVRCEKLSSWMLAEGYEEIYQLDGGILHYLNSIPEPESKWQGECYVFDERVAVGHHCHPSTTATMCRACGHALTPADRQHPSWKQDEQCGFCAKDS